MIEIKEIDGGISIKNGVDFSIRHTLDCGQIFRYEKRDFGYNIYVADQKIEVFCQNDATNFFCKNEKFLKKYLDLDTKYDIIKHDLKKFEHLPEAIDYGYGIHILNQPKLETLISFIISANNNIPRIKKILNLLCQTYGTKIDDYFAFPSIETLSKITEDDFKKIGCGYRANYLVNTISQIENGFDLEKIALLKTSDARNELMKLKGVGRKVADCVLLFAYHKTDVFPTDTWITKVYEDWYGKTNLSAEKISLIFTNIFGDLSGYAQQYLFYQRMNK